MSMLAGPRRKQKIINLRAKNNAWSNDATKFGQRMLEKMGWSSGKGLGANENGIVEHVVAKYKNDEKGLGFDDKNDQWTKHEDDFNALLANLSNDSGKEIMLHSGVSLEDKSKKSKARIHYHKFSRAKDLSRYSEKDLANIFGKKSFKMEGKKVEDSKDDVQMTEQVFTEKGSMEDYFKNKLAAFRSKHHTGLSFNQESYNNDLAYGFKGFAGTSYVEEDTEAPQGFQAASSSSYNNVEGPEQNEEQRITSKKSKKKKKKKNKDNIAESKTISDKTPFVTDTEFNYAVQELEKDLLIKKEKKSKKNISPMPYTSCETETPVTETTCKPEVVEPVKKKKKKSQGETLELTIPPEIISEGDTKPKKKKKKSKDIKDK